MKPPRRPAAIRRFLRARDGATAVEFAFVAAPFLLLLFAIVELSLVFIATTGLDNATENAAREIRTGAFQKGASATKTEFRDLVCDNMPILPSNCGSNLYVDVRTFNTFSDLSANYAQAGAAFDDSKTCFSPGQARDIVLVRVYYSWPLVTPLITAAFANTASGKARMLSAVAVFKNEPYNDDPPVGAKC